MKRRNKYTVEPHSCGPASSETPPLTDTKSTYFPQFPLLAIIRCLFRQIKLVHPLKPVRAGFYCMNKNSSNHNSEKTTLLPRVSLHGALTQTTTTTRITHCVTHKREKVKIAKKKKKKEKKKERDKLDKEVFCVCLWKQLKKGNSLRHTQEPKSQVQEKRNKAGYTAIQSRTVGQEQ